ncbi:hypothetical protein ACOMHN_030355 [Nucella lapillus]
MKLVVRAILLQLALTLAFGDADRHTDPRIVRRGWSMMRLGRGLQMLRLGKRMLPPSPSHNSQATPSKMRELLDDLLEDSKDEFLLRQMLLPQGVDEDVLEDLNTLLEEASQPDSHPYPQIHTGRFKRSADFKIRRELTSNPDQSQPRPVSSASSRIGQYLGHLYKLRLTKSNPVLRGERHQKVGEGDVMIIDTTGSDDVTSKTAVGREKAQKKHVTDPEAL